MLLSFLTLPEALVRPRQPGSSVMPLLWSSEIAAAYTCEVLMDLGKPLAPDLEYMSYCGGFQSPGLFHWNKDNDT